MQGETTAPLRRTRQKRLPLSHHFPCHINCPVDISGCATWHLADRTGVSGTAITASRGRVGGREEWRDSGSKNKGIHLNWRDPGKGRHERTSCHVYGYHSCLRFSKCLMSSNSGGWILTLMAGLYPRAVAASLILLAAVFELAKSARVNKTTNPCFLILESKFIFWNAQRTTNKGMEDCDCCILDAAS